MSSGELLLTRYLEQNYSASCRRHVEFTFFDSFQFVQVSSHLMFFLTFPAKLLGFFCILRKTPLKMSSVKFYLLNLQFWSTYLDVLYTTLVMPVFFFPALATCSIGLLSMLNIDPIYIYQLSLFGFGGLATATIMIFEYRAISLSRTQTGVGRKFLKPIRIIWHCSNFSISIFVAYSLKISVAELDLAKYKYLKILPCPIPEYFTHCNLALKNDDWTYVIMSAIFLIFVSSQVLLFAFFSFLKIFLIKSSLISTTTRRLQKSLFIGTCLQVSVPLVVIVIPVIYCFLVIINQYYNQAYLNFTSIIISLHGFVASATLLMVNSPYRQFTVSLFLPKLYQKSYKNQATLIVTAFVQKNTIS